MNTLKKLSDKLRELRSRFRLWRKPKKDCNSCCLWCKYFNRCKSKLNRKIAQDFFKKCETGITEIKKELEKSADNQSAINRCLVVVGKNSEECERIKNEIEKLVNKTSYSITEITDYIYYTSVYFGTPIDDIFNDLWGITKGKRKRRFYED